MMAALFALYGGAAVALALVHGRQDYESAHRWTRTGWLAVLGVTLALGVLAGGLLERLGLVVAASTFYVYALPALRRVAGARPSTAIGRPATTAAAASLVVVPTPDGTGASPVGGDDVPVALGPCIGGMITLWALGEGGVPQVSRWRVDDPGGLERVLTDDTAHRSALRSARTEQVAQDVGWVPRHTWANGHPQLFVPAGTPVSTLRQFSLRWPASAADRIATTVHEVTSTFVARLHLAARTGTRLGAYSAGGTTTTPAVTAEVRNGSIRLTADKKPRTGLWWANLDGKREWSLELSSTDPMWRAAAHQLHDTMSATYAVPPGDVVVGYSRVPDPIEG